MTISYTWSEFDANEPYVVLWSIKKYSLLLVFPCSDRFLSSKGTGSQG